MNINFSGFTFSCGIPGGVSDISICICICICICLWWMEWLSLKIKRRGLLIDFWCSWLWSKNMSVMGALSNTWSVVLPALILSESEERNPVQFVNGLHDVKFGPHWVKFQVRGRNSCCIVFRYDSSESAIFASWFADRQGVVIHIGQRVIGGSSRHYEWPCRLMA